MPAARRYKQSLVDEMRNAINSLPAGNPPEPELKKNEVLEVLKADLRRRHLDEHVDIAEIVKALNEKGFSVNAAEIRKTVSPKKAKNSKSATSASPGGAKSRTSKNAISTASGSKHNNAGKTDGTTVVAKGGFEVRPDEDDD